MARLSNAELQAKLQADTDAKLEANNAKLLAQIAAMLGTQGTDATDAKKTPKGRDAKKTAKAAPKAAPDFTSLKQLKYDVSERFHGTPEVSGTHIYGLDAKDKNLARISVVKPEYARPDGYTGLFIAKGDCTMTSQELRAHAKALVSLADAMDGK